jgi:hypothetical protein
MFHPFSRPSTDARTLSNEQILIQVVLSLPVTPAVTSGSPGTKQQLGTYSQIGETSFARCYLSWPRQRRDSASFSFWMSAHPLLAVAKTITNITFRQDVCWTRRLVFYLLSELIDQYTEVFAFVAVLRPPY